MVAVGVCLDFKIFCKNVESVEILSFILVKTLYLNIKN